MAKKEGKSFSKTITFLSFLLLLDGSLRIALSFPVDRLIYDIYLPKKTLSLPRAGKIIWSSYLGGEKKTKIERPTRQNYGPYRLRWLAVGVVEILLTIGILERNLTALYVLTGLSVIRILTVFLFPPEGLIFPLPKNTFLYMSKIVIMVLAFLLFFNKDLYLLQKRKPKKNKK